MSNPYPQKKYQANITAQDKGTIDQLVLAIANVDGNGGVFYAGMVLDEYN
jgi:hypothetical protein